MSSAVSGNLSATFPSYMTKASIGKKVLMAVTGVIAFGYVVGHMLGNLQIFIGQDQINAYAVTLHSMGPLLWIVRAFLLAAFAVHIWMGIQLKLENWAARPVSYEQFKPEQTSLASRTMIWTGLIVLAFVIYHILQFTALVTHPQYKELHAMLNGQQVHDVYSMVIIGFSNYAVSAFYVIAVGLLSYHLSHGVASMFQSLGLNNPSWQKRLDGIAWFFTFFLFVGYTSIPVSILAGWVVLPEGVMP